MPSTPEKLKSGNWRCIAYLGYDSDNKQRRKSFTAETAKKARQLAVQAEAEFDTTGIRPGEDAPSSDGMTLGEAMERYIAAKNQLSPSTLIGYNKIRRNHYIELQRKNIADITVEDIQIATSTESGRHAPKTVLNAHGFLVAVFAMYRTDLKISTALPQAKTPELVIPELEDIKAIVSAASDAGDSDLKLSVLLGYQLGLRRSEICALTFADIRDGKTVSINKALVKDEKSQWVVKGTKSTAGKRIVPLTDDCICALKQRSGEPTDRIISITPDIITKRFGRIRESLGLPSFRFHDLRHYNASVMIALNVPFFYISRRLGHKSTDMVMRVYGHILANKQDDINDQLNEFFK